MIAPECPYIRYWQLKYGIDNFIITRNMLIERDVTSGAHYSLILEYFVIA